MVLNNNRLQATTKIVQIHFFASGLVSEQSVGKGLSIYIERCVCRAGEERQFATRFEFAKGCPHLIEQVRNLITQIPKRCGVRTLALKVLLRWY